MKRYKASINTGIYIRTMRMTNGEPRFMGYVGEEAVIRDIKKNEVVGKLLGHKVRKNAKLVVGTLNNLDPKVAEVLIQAIGSVASDRAREVMDKEFRRYKGRSFAWPR